MIWNDNGSQIVHTWIGIWNDNLARIHNPWFEHLIIWWQCKLHGPIWQVKPTGKDIIDFFTNIWVIQGLHCNKGRIEKGSHTDYSNHVQWNTMNDIRHKFLFRIINGFLLGWSSKVWQIAMQTKTSMKGNYIHQYFFTLHSWCCTKCDLFTI